MKPCQNFINVLVLLIFVFASVQCSDNSTPITAMDGPGSDFSKITTDAGYFDDYSPPDYYVNDTILPGDGLSDTLIAHDGPAVVTDGATYTCASANVYKSFVPIGNIGTLNGSVSKTDPNLYHIDSASCAIKVGNSSPVLGSANDRLFEVFLEQAVRYVIILEPTPSSTTCSNYYPMLYVLNRCTAGAGVCEAFSDQNLNHEPEYIDFTPVTSGYYYILVDSESTLAGSCEFQL